MVFMVSYIMEANIFFRPDGTEYIWDIDAGDWQKTQLGWYSVYIYNLYKDNDLQKLVELTGVSNEDDMIKPVTCVNSLTLGMAAARGKARTNRQPHSFPGWAMAQWGRLWLECKVVPIMHPRLGLGWIASAPTLFHAAVIETTFSFLHGWKGKFRICRWCKHLFYGNGKNEACSECRRTSGKEHKMRERFVNLLYQHKHDCGDKEELKRGIDSFVQKAREEDTEIRPVVQEYSDFCRINDMPMKWVQKYRYFFTE
ncbi:MAG: hypothetical protein AB1500_09715 [Bacillota bacterium]